MDKYKFYGIFFLIIHAIVIIRNYGDNYLFFFWYCDFVPILLSIGFFIKKTNFIKALINVGFLPQILFLIDFINNMITGKSLFLLTNELFSAGPFFIISTFVIHLSTSFALLFTYKKEPNKRALYYSALILVLIYAMTLSFTPSNGDVNFIYNSSNGLHDFVAYVPYYTELWVFLAFVLLILPTQLVQHIIYKKFGIQSHSKRNDY